MVEAQPSTQGSGAVTAVIGAVAGPVGVLMYETGNLDLFRAMPLINVWLVVLLGVIGVCVGATAVRRGTVVLGIVCLVANSAVLGLYGFLAAFFAFGGSR